MLCDPLRGGKFVAHRGDEFEHVLHHAAKCTVLPVRQQRTGVVAHHLGGDGVQLRIRNQPRVRFRRHEQAVFTDQGACIRVIGGHLRCDDL